MPKDTALNCPNVKFDPINDSNAVDSNGSLIRVSCVGSCATPEQVLTTVSPNLTTDVTSKCYAIPKLAGCEEYY